MKKINLFLVVIASILFPLVVSAQNVPLINELKQVSQLPAEIPQRVTSLAFDGEKLWFGIYLDQGRYATFNPQTKEWKYSDSEFQHQQIRKVTQPFSSAGGMVFDGKKLWLSGSYGESFGCINTENWQVEKVFNQVVRPDLKETNSQSYASMAFDGRNIWIAWHMTHYRLPDSEVQQLLKVEPETGKVIEKYPLPVGTKPDMTHGLTFDGVNLWHTKDRKLSAIDLNGQVTAQYELKGLKRPSGLAWDGNSLWIVEFDGKVWNLPFKTL